MKRIIIAGNNELDIRLLYSISEEFGFSPIVTSREDEVNEIIDFNDPDIVFSGFRPDFDGIRVVKSIRNRTVFNFIPVFIYSAFSDEIYISELYSQGVDEFFRTPVKLSNDRLKNAMMFYSEVFRKIRSTGITYFDFNYNNKIFLTNFEYYCSNRNMKFMRDIKIIIPRTLKLRRLNVIEILVSNAIF